MKTIPNFKIKSVNYSKNIGISGRLIWKRCYTNYNLLSRGVIWYLPYFYFLLFILGLWASLEPKHVNKIGMFSTIFQYTGEVWISIL